MVTLRRFRLALFAGSLLLTAACGQDDAPPQPPAQESSAMKPLPADLIGAIQSRIADPVQRHDDLGGTAGETLTDPTEVFARLERENPELGSTPFRDCVDQLHAWGNPMPPMHFTSYPDGSLGASSTEESALPLAEPATAADIAKLETMIGRSIPADLRSLYAIADGGWGPGIAFTMGHGRGIQSLRTVRETLADLRRRGPGYTGEAEWPANLLPIADRTGPISYDLDTGRIVAFNDYYYDDGQTIDQAFTVIHPSLETWLREWVVD